VVFSEARGRFENIFRISGRTAKIPDRGLILEKPEGPSAKSAKSGPRVDMGKAEGPECKSDWNFDYQGIILLKEISWTKSTGLWTDERAPAHGSTVDRAPYPFGVLIWGVPFGFDGWEEGGRGNGGRGRHDWATRWRGHQRTTRIGFRGPRDHRGLAGTKRENWGTHSEPHRRVGGIEAAGR
jgi:hypothetical protein